MAYNILKMDQELIIDWGNALKGISKSSISNYYIKMPHTLLFDSLEALKPFLWLYTNTKGQAVFKDLSDLHTEQAISFFLYKVKSLDPTFAIVLKTNERVIIDRPIVKQFMYQNKEKVRALQVIKCHSYSLQRQIISHKVMREKSQIIEKIKVRPMVAINESKSYLLNDEKLKVKIRSLSDLMLNALCKYSQIHIRTISFLYQIETVTSEAWLCGIAKCRCISIPTTNLTSVLANSSLSLMKKRRKLFKKLNRSHVTLKKRPLEIDKHISQFKISEDFDRIDSGILLEYANIEDNSVSRPLTTNNLAFSEVKFDPIDRKIHHQPRRLRIHSKKNLSIKDANFTLTGSNNQTPLVVSRKTPTRTPYRSTPNLVRARFKSNNF